MATIIDNKILDTSNLEMQGGPAFSTQVVRTQSGWRQANVNWEYALWKMRLRFVAAGESSGGYFDDLIAFFLARRGPAYPFLVRDPKDYSDSGQGKVLLVNGSYRLVKEYPDTVRPYRRLITRPDDGSVVLTGVAGNNLSVSTTTGIVANAESEGTATFTFTVPMALQGDPMNYSYEAGDIGDWSCELEEVRV